MNLPPSSAPPTHRQTQSQGAVQLQPLDAILSLGAQRPGHRPEEAGSARVCPSCRANLQGDKAAKRSRRLACIEGRTTCVAIVAMWPTTKWAVCA
jgi:hypothetical protein